MKYSVKVKEISYGVVEVEAASAEEPKKKPSLFIMTAMLYGAIPRWIAPLNL